MKSEYIAELLNEKKMVILPGLGALSYTPGSPIPYTFNSFLKFNDGILAGYVSLKENISTDEAGKKIETFVSGLLSALDSGQEIIITNIGKLKKSATGKLEFSSISQGEKLEKSTWSEPVIEKKNTETDKLPNKPVEIKDEPKTKNTPDKKTEPQQEKIKPESEIKVKKEKPVSDKNKNTKNKKRLILWIILLLILVGGGTAGYIFRENIINKYHEFFTKNETTKIKEKHEQPKDVAVEEPQNIIVEEPVDTTLAETPVNEKPEKITTETTYGNYYIVIGCFSSRENAEKMIAKSNVKGYATVDMGVISNLNYVAAATATDMATAKDLLNKIKNDFPSAWIMKR